MKAWGVTEDDVRTALAAANVHYDGNLELREVRTEGVRVFTVSFMLRTLDNRGTGCRRTKQRRTTSACWHAHRDVLRALFAINPDARVKTMLAHYRGSADFESSYRETCAVQCWQGGMQRDRREECTCTGDEDGVPADEDYNYYGLSDDAHRVAKLGDTELEAWAEILATARHGRKH